MSEPASLKTKLDRGIAAAQAGDKKTARALLKEVVEVDQRQVAAWLWLYKVADSLEEKEICLENVLVLEPNNQYATERLARVKTEQNRFFAAPYHGSQQDDDETTPVTLAAAENPPIRAQYPYKDEFDNELLCPYCLALTRRQDRSCPGCGRALIVRKRVREERTTWLWRGIILQLVLSFFLLAAGAGYMTLVAKLYNIPNPMPFLPLYFGRTVDQPEQAVQVLLQVFPPWLFWGIIVASLYALILMVLLYVRVPYGNVIYFITGTITAGLGVVGILFFHDPWLGLGAGILALLVGLTQLIISFNLWNDFTFKEGRILLRLDRGVKNVRSLAISGRKYSELGMWGLAVIHLRRAVLREPANSSHHVGLVLAYLRVNRYDLAAKALNNADDLSIVSKELNLVRQELKP